MDGAFLSNSTADGGEPRRKLPRVRRRLMQAARAVLARIDRRVFPPAESSTEHWQRVAMNRAVDEYIDSLQPLELTAAEISGDTHAEKPWKSYTSLNYPSFDLCADLDP